MTCTEEIEKDDLKKFSRRSSQMRCWADTIWSSFDPKRFVNFESKPCNMIQSCTCGKLERSCDEEYNDNLFLSGFSDSPLFHEDEEVADELNAGRLSTDSLGRSFSDYHWDRYDSRPCYRLTFAGGDGNELWNSVDYSEYHMLRPENPCSRLANWSMTLTSDADESTRSSTSWRKMKENRHNSAYEPPRSVSSSPLPLYKIFQASKRCLNSDYESLFACPKRQDAKISMIGPDRYKSNGTVDCCDRGTQFPSYVMDRSIQTSICDKINLSAYHFTNKSLQTDQNIKYVKYRPMKQEKVVLKPFRSLPNLNFLQHYAKESSFISMVSDLSKKSTPKPRKLRAIKRYKLNKHCTEPFMPVCDSLTSSDGSSSSSGYFSSPRPLKSCLKRPNLLFRPKSLSRRPVFSEALFLYSSGIIFTIARKSTKLRSRLHRRWVTNSDDQLFRKSHQNLNAKKSVSFSESIAAHLIAPNNYSSHELRWLTGIDHKTLLFTLQQKRVSLLDSDQLSLSSFTDSPPSEFPIEHTNWSFDSDSNCYPQNCVLTASDDSNDVFNTTKQESSSGTTEELVRRITEAVNKILEFRTSDTCLLDNEMNPSLDLVLRHEFCFALKELLEDGLHQASGLFSRRMSLWKVIETCTMLSTASRQFHEARVSADIQSPSLNGMGLTKFIAFTMILLNSHELSSFIYFIVKQKDVLIKYYEPTAFILVRDAEVFGQFERLMTALDKLCPLPFHLSYSSHESNFDAPLVSPTAIKNIVDRINIRGWFRRGQRPSASSYKRRNAAHLPDARKFLDGFNGVLSSSSSTPSPLVQRCSSEPN